jgi:hypothetical protein
MIHYTCDRCHRAIDPRAEVRYTVRIEVGAADGAAGEGDCGRPVIDDGMADLLDDLADQLEGDDFSDRPSFAPRVYDLCSCCHARFIADPLGAESPASASFSEN